MRGVGLVDGGHHMAGADGVYDTGQLHDRDIGTRGPEKHREDRGCGEERSDRSQHAKVYWIQRVPVNFDGYGKIGDAMIGSLGGPEILLILVIALIVFGPRRLPEIGKSMGRMLAEFRKASNDFKRTIEEEVEADKLRALASPYASAEAPVPPEPPPAQERGSPPAIEADPHAVSQGPPPIEPK